MGHLKGSLLTKLTRLAIRVVDLLLRRAQIRQRVVFVSYFSRNPEGNLRCVCEWLQLHTDVSIVRHFGEYKGGINAKLKYAIHTIKEAYYISTSAVIVLEGNSFVLSIVKKKKGVKAIQLWHAAGAFKRFGADTHRMYKISGLDAAIVSTPEVAEIYSRALNVPMKKVIATGIPRADIYFSEDFTSYARCRVESLYPHLAGKKIALYAPTFRGKGIDDISLPKIDLSSVLQGFDNWELAVRAHPMMTESIEGGADFSSINLMEALAASDLLITDYSSIIFEYSLLNRPMLFFTPDKSSFDEERGFYFGYDDFVPGKICNTTLELHRAIAHEDFDRDKLTAFRRRFIYGFDGNATERAAQVILKMMG